MSKVKKRDISVHVKNADMTDEMMQFSCETIEEEFANCSSEKQMADNIRDIFNLKFESTWQVIIGRNFGSDVQSYSTFSLILYHAFLYAQNRSHMKRKNI